MIKMALVGEYGILKWNSANRKRYEELGYNFTKYRDEFSVKIEHLTPTTRALVWVLCDYCKLNKKETTYKNYMSIVNRSHTKKDACNDCLKLKTKETNLEKYGAVAPTCNDEIKRKVRETTKKNYGVEYNTQSQEVKDKVKESVLNKYGVENVFQLEEIKQKSIETNREKYGVDYYNQTDEHKDRIRMTNLEKYGVEYSSQSEEIKKRVRETNIKKYGVPASIQNKDIRKKGRITLFKNNTAPTSLQQKYLHSLLGGELNYPIEYMSADIAFPKENIIVEYDGGGHWLSVTHGNITMEEFNKKEQRRNYFLYGRGWKIIRIISRKDKLPTDEEIISFVNKAKEYIESGHRWMELDIDEEKIKCSQYEDQIKFSKLRMLKRTIKTN